MNTNLYQTAPFKHVSDMEAPLKTVRDILRGLAMIAETLDNDAGSAVQTLSWLAERECGVAEALRCELFKQTHPNRGRFEREGWPS